MPETGCWSKRGGQQQAPTVDVLVVTYNGSDWLPGLLDSLVASDYPMGRLRLIVVDNDSKDDTIAYLTERSRTLPVPLDVVATGANGGFTGGYGVAFTRARADYWFVLNQDTRVAPDAIRLLVETLESDAKAGIAEARQSPGEHPKYRDPFTRETSWCSGACMMLRRQAIEQVGGFDRAFYMYVEDVDLSWRMWLNDWKCLYVAEAVVEHFTEELDSFCKPPILQHYYGMRNGAIMRVAYGTATEALRHYGAMLRLAVFTSTPLWHRWGTIKGLVASLWNLPVALRKRWSLPRRQHPWVSFNGWEYGRHIIDLADGPGPVLPQADTRQILVDFDALMQAVVEQSVEQPHLTIYPDAQADEAGEEPRIAILTHYNAGFHYDLHVPPNAALHGLLGHSKCERWGRGTFTMEQDGRQIFRLNVCRDKPEQARWLPFSARLKPSAPGQTSRLCLRYMTETGGTWGYWTELEIATQNTAPEPAPFLGGCKVSVVIPTHNRGNGLVRVVQRLLEQDFEADAHEVVLVDSSSTDHTPAVLEELAKDPRVRAFRCEKKGAAAARNVGLDNARGQLVVLLDDDIFVRRDFLERLWKAHQDDPNRVLLARIMHPFEGTVDPFLRFLRQAQEVNIYNFPDPGNVPPDYFFTGCVAVPKHILGNVRFDEGFRVYGVEDIDFGVKLLREEIRMSFLADVEVWHDYYPNFEYFRRKKAHAGFSLGYFLRKHPWRKQRYVFQPKIVKYHRWLRWGVFLTRPVGLLLEEIEKLRYGTGPINRWLALWYKVAIRVAQYRGMLLFYETKGRTEALPRLGYRDTQSVRASRSRAG